MKKIEPAATDFSESLTARIQDFWSRRVNAERIMGRAITEHPRGEDAYFQDLETQRYRSHRHLPTWIEAMEPGKTVLEIGCGVGLDTYRMANRGLEVTAVDLTHVGVSTAFRRFRQHGLAGEFLVADACSLPFPDDSFDYVYSFGVLHHVADTRKAICEARRLLKPGGEAQIMLYHRHSLNEFVHRLLGVPFEDKDELCPVVRRFTMEEAQELFRDFQRLEIKIEYLFGEGYGAMFRLMPKWLYKLLSRQWGWHLMIKAVK